LGRFCSLLSLVMIIMITPGSPVFSAAVGEKTDQAITGILVKVDLKKHAIYVKENSRIVRFKASVEFCEKFKNKINSEVDITYKIGNNKSLQIITIVISEKKDKIEPSEKPKAAVKKVKKK